MSMNRMRYDTCAYSQSIAQSVSPLEFILDPIKYEHCQKCRMELGVVGGTAVSHIKGNLVDLENDLRGQNRPNTHCPSYKYIPTNGPLQGKEYIKPVQHPAINIDMQHLRPCQMISYGPVPLEPNMDLYKCGA